MFVPFLRQVFFVLAFHIHSLLIVWLELCSRSNSFHLAAFSMGKGRKTRGKKYKKHKTSGKNDNKHKMSRKATASRKRRASTSSSSSSCSSTSSSSSSCSSAENKDDKLFRRGLCLYALPVLRLQAMIKSADKLFDETWTVPLTSAEASSLLWALTHIKPSSKSNAIGATTYREGKAACKCAAQRKRKLMGQQVYDLMVTEVLRAGPGDFLPVIEKYGFKPEWVCPPSKKRRAPNDSHSSRAEAPRKLAPPTTSQSIAEAPPGNAHPVQSPIPTSQGSAETSPGDEEGPPDLALRTTSASNAEALPDLTPLAPAQDLTSDLVPRTTSPSNEEALPNVAPLASAQGNPQRPPNQGPRTTSPSNAEALPEPAPLAPAQVLTSEQQARIMENRARALAKRRARIKAKKKAKAQARRIASSLD